MCRVVDTRALNPECLRSEFQLCYLLTVGHGQLLNHSLLPYLLNGENNGKD